MKIFYLLFFSFFLLIKTNAQNIGVGTNMPKAAFHVEAGKTVLFGSDSTTSDNKLIYFGAKGAIRSGYVPNPGANVGVASAAFGSNNTASGYASFAGGSDNVASATATTALGVDNTASMEFSTAIGWRAQATNFVSIAIGTDAISSGVQSIAIGNDLTASGIRSMALGNKVNNNGYTGSFIIGDDDPKSEGVTYSGSSNQFVARFANGYYLLTSGTNVRTGVQIAAGGNAWLSISDKNRKENFELLNDESVLKKLSAITYSSWNYKGQDPKTFRHYGIMAQDFYEAFGKDSFGNIGCDTLVNPLDMQGITFSAIKALEIRTREIETLKEEIKELQKLVAILMKRDAPASLQ